MVVSTERRRHERYSFQRHLEVRASGPDYLVVRAHDISQSGFSFLADRPFEVGQRIVLALRSDDEFSIEATVRYARRDPDASRECYIVGAERLEAS
jgi:hypothetical protein